MKEKNPWLWVPSLYFSNGVAYVAITTLAIILYKQLGLSNAEITIYTAWLQLPWFFKPIWKLLFQAIKNKHWWVLGNELLIGTALGGVALTIPTPSWLQGTLCFFWLLTFAGVTHDAASEELYKAQLDTERQAWFAGIRSIFYRLAMIFGQGVLVMFVGNLQIIHRNSISLSWSLTFYVVAGIMLLFSLWHLLALTQKKEEEIKTSFKKITSQLITQSIHQLCAEKSKTQIWVTSLLILCYAIPQGLLNKVSTIFFIDANHRGGLGLSPQEFGLVQGTIGVLALATGSFMSGLAIGQTGLKYWKWSLATTLTLPNLIYIYLSDSPPTSLLSISAIVFLQQICYGFGITTFMIYLMSFSKGYHTRRNYSLATIFMGCVITIATLASGSLQMSLGYHHFFRCVLACSLLLFLIIPFAQIDPNYGKQEDIE